MNCENFLLDVSNGKPDKGIAGNLLFSLAYGAESALTLLNLHQIHGQLNSVNTEEKNNCRKVLISK